MKYLNGLVTTRRRLQAAHLEEIAVYSIVKAELFYGAIRSNSPDLAWAKTQRFLRVLESLSFDDIVGLTAGRICVFLGANGTPIGYNDLLIATIAVANNLTLVTHNTDEFNRVAELEIEDWEVDE